MVDDDSSQNDDEPEEEDDIGRQLAYYQKIKAEKLAAAAKEKVGSQKKRASNENQTPAKRPAKRPAPAASIIDPGKPPEPLDSEASSVLLGESPSDKAPPKGGHCRAEYIAKGNDKRVLFAMSIGIKTDDGRELGNTEIDPYKSMKNKSSCKPNLVHLRDEIRRHSKHKLKQQKIPKCNNYGVPKCSDWLNKNPVTDAEDIAFLKGEELVFYTALLNFMNSKKADTADRSPQWQSILPYLRLYHVACDERVRAALRDKYKSLTQPELDGRNCEDRPLSFEEFVAKLFNDEENVYESYALPVLHSAFSEKMTLKFSDMPGPITAEDVKTCLANSRACMEKIVAKWDKSGKGHGSRADDELNVDDEGIFLEEENQQVDADYGRITDVIKMIGGNNRSEFLGEFAVHILHYWHLSDVKDIIKEVLNKVAKSFTASSSSGAVGTTNAVQNSRTEKQTPTKTAKFKRPKVSSASDDPFCHTIAESMSNVAYASACAQLKEHRKYLLDSKMMKLKTTDPEEKKLIDEYISNLQVTITDLETRLNSMKKKLDNATDDNKK